MQSERPEYTETKRARWKAWACAIAAVIAPIGLTARGFPEAAPYAFTAFAVLAAVLGLTVETDRLHRRVDALRDGD